jgi:hypothetical protein
MLLCHQDGDIGHEKIENDCTLNCLSSGLEKNEKVIPAVTQGF